MIIYKLPEKQLWNGRVDDDNPNSLRFHQIINCMDINKVPINNNSFSIIGFECDEGVRRNKGKIGAALAPNKIRKFLANLPYNDIRTETIDVGNVVCKNGEMEKAQEKLGLSVTKLFQRSSNPIIIGGGHETLYGHYLGVRGFIGKEASLGIINIDAHFDLRDDDLPSSGTMFKQILEQDNNAGYLCLAVQRFGNTQSLFEEADHYKVRYIFEEDVATNNFHHTFQTINEFSNQYDYIILTLCTDSINSTAAPGVSAPSPFGLAPEVARILLRYIVSKENLLSFDISEVNPLVDENNKTARLAAYLIAEVRQSFEERRNQ